MPPQQRASSRGRRDPALLAQGTDQEREAFAVGEAPDGEFDGQAEPDPVDEHGVYLYEGESITFRASIPTTLAGMDRYSIIEAAATGQVQDGEDATLTAARIRDAVRKQYWTGVDELEQDIAAILEQQAAEDARIRRATGQR